MTSTAESIDFLRRLHASGRRTRSRAEARAELVAACRGLGERAAEWRAAAYIPDADLGEVDAAIEGIRRLLTELRATQQEGPPNAA